MVKNVVQRGRSEVRDAKHNERHVCGRRRDGEPAVSCENKAGGLFQQPATDRSPISQARPAQRDRTTTRLSPRRGHNRSRTGDPKSSTEHPGWPFGGPDPCCDEYGGTAGSRIPIPTSSISTSRSYASNCCGRCALP